MPAHAAEVGAGANEEAAPLQQRLFFYPVPRDLTGVFVAVPQRPPPAKKMLAHTLSLVPAVQHSAPACMLVCASPRHIVATASAGSKASHNGSNLGSNIVYLEKFLLMYQVVNEK